MKFEVSASDRAYAAECNAKMEAGCITNKPMDRGLCQEAAEILGLIHNLADVVSELRVQLFGAFPENAKAGKAERMPSLSGMLMDSRIALGALIEEVRLLRSKAE